MEYRLALHADPERCCETCEEDIRHQGAPGPARQAVFFVAPMNNVLASRAFCHQHFINGLERMHQRHS